MSEEEIKAIEILRLSPIFRGRKPENDCLEIVLKLIEKLQKVIDLMAIELFNYANLNILGICEAELENGNYDMNLCKMSLANRNCCECIKKHFYKKVEEEK